MSGDRFFLDTNVLVYAGDTSAPAKLARARELIRDAFDSRRGCISTQVLQEYFSVSTRKAGVTGSNARDRVVRFGHLDVVQVTPDLVLSAIDLHLIHGLAFWDALIVKSAAAAGCRRLYSEDLQGDRVVDGVRIVNPFEGL